MNTTLVTSIDNDPNEQDLLDLNDWCMSQNPTLYDATKYLSDVSRQRLIWQKAWEAAGRPSLNWI